MITPAPAWPRAIGGVPLTDPAQDWWDLRYLGGDDRREAADRLASRVMLDGRRVELAVATLDPPIPTHRVSARNATR